MLEFHIVCELCYGSGFLGDGDYQRKCSDCKGEKKLWVPVTDFPEISTWIENKAWQLYMKFNSSPHEVELNKWENEKNLMDSCIKSAVEFYCALSRFHGNKEVRTI